MTYVQLFFSFLLVGLFSVGGGYAAIPLIQAQVVEAHGWLTMAEFTNLVTIAEMTPGPIAVNSATFVGIRIAGVPGAVVATLGCIFPALILVSVLAYLYRRYQSAPALDSVLSCLRPAVVALIAAAGLAMLGTAVLGGAAPAPGNVQWASAALFCAALVLLRWRKWNPILVMCLCGAPSAKRNASAAPVPACEAQNRKRRSLSPLGKRAPFCVCSVRLAHGLKLCRVVRHHGFQRACAAAQLVHLRGFVQKRIQLCGHIAILLGHQADFVVLLFHQYARVAHLGLQRFLPRLHLFQPRAQCVLPGAQFVLPGAQFVLPRAQLVLPGAQFVLPGAQLVLPGAQLVLPGFQFGQQMQNHLFIFHSPTPLLCRMACRPCCSIIPRFAQGGKAAG